MAAVSSGARRRKNPDTAPLVNARALVASGRRIDPTDTRVAASLKRLKQDWQKSAWIFYKTLSEVHYAHDYYGNVVSRVRLYAGFQADPDDAPVALDDVDEDDFELPDEADPATATAALAAIKRLDDSSDGGLPGIAGDFAVNLALAGEGWLYGTPSDDSPTGEEFRVYSTEEFKAADDGYYVHEDGASLGTKCGPDDFVGRIWRRLRCSRLSADAPMMALLQDCDNLLILKRVLQAVSNSRMHGGIFLYPQEWTFPQRETDPNSDGQARDDPLMRQMEQAFITPLRDPGDPSSVVPLSLKGPADTLDKARWLDIGRGYGEDILKQIADQRTGLAVGLDLPVEVLTGVGDVNHWSAWQIAEETFKQHIEPLVQVICRGLTDAWLNPILRAEGYDPSGFCVWYDPSALIGHPDLFANMAEMHRVYAVSDAALRRAGGASDDDAPDEEEIQRRLYIAQQERVTIREQGIAPAGEIQTEDALNPPDGTAAPTAGQPAPVATAPPSPAPAAQGAPKGTTASGQRVSNLSALGPRLAALDRELFVKVQAQADAALQRVLERAGSVLLRAAERQDKKFATELKNVSRVGNPAEVGWHIGEDRARAWGLTEDKIIDGQLGILAPSFAAATRSTLAKALRAGDDAVADRDLTDAQIDGVLESHDGKWATAGFAILSGAVLAAAHAQLYEPPLLPSTPGEVDLTARVPTAAIRDAISTAGGGAQTQSTEPPGGVATGTLVTDAFADALGILPAAWQWVYGYPDREFDPHYQLEGVEFSTWTDELLANPGDWPPVEYLYPGDHLGCLCTFIPMFEGDRPADQPPEEGEA